MPQDGTPARPRELGGQHAPRWGEDEGAGRRRWRIRRCEQDRHHHDDQVRPGGEGGHAGPSAVGPPPRVTRPAPEKTPASLRRWRVRTMPARVSTSLRSLDRQPRTRGRPGGGVRVSGWEWAVVGAVGGHGVAWWEMRGRGWVGGVRRRGRRRWSGRSTVSSSAAEVVATGLVGQDPAAADHHDAVGRDGRPRAAWLAAAPPPREARARSRSAASAGPAGRGRGARRGSGRPGRRAVRWAMPRRWRIPRRVTGDAAAALGWGEADLGEAPRRRAGGHAEGRAARRSVSRRCGRGGSVAVQQRAERLRAGLGRSA